MNALQKVIKYCAVAFAVFLTVTIIGGILSAVSLIMGIFSSEDMVESNQAYTVSGTIQKLDIELAAADLEIVTGDTFEVKTNHKYLSVEEKGETLEITEKKVFFGVSSKGIRVTLYIPEDSIFEEVRVSTAAGKVTVDSLSAHRLRMELGAGSTRINNLTASNEARIDGGAGEVVIDSGTLHDARIAVAVGRMDLSCRLTGDSKIDCGVGETELNLLDSAGDYRIELDKGLGQAVVDGVTMESGGVYGNGVHEIDIDGGVGSIRVRFSE